MNKGCLSIPSSEKGGKERGGELGPQVLKALVRSTVQEWDRVPPWGGGSDRQAALSLHFASLPLSVSH